MDPDDDRHGTQAGFNQHRRDDEDPCDACREGDNVASRRRRKRRTMGHQFTSVLGEPTYQHLIALRDRGATYQQIADWAGVSFRTAYAAITEGPELRVYTTTKAKLRTVRAPEHVVTAVGIARRIQGLQRIGYSVGRLARETGISHTWMLQLRDGIAGNPNHETRQKILDLYQRLHMTPAAEDTHNQRKSVSRARNYAIAQGWPGPLMWEEAAIDDPHGRPASRWERGSGQQSSLDHAVVDRVLAGGSRPRKLTAAESAAVISGALARGHSTYEISQLYGIKVERHHRQGDAA